jgi:aldose 1-epimerase
MEKFQRGVSGVQYQIRYQNAKGVVFEACIASIGASLREYKADNVNITVPYKRTEFTPIFSGIVLFPWPNRLEDGKYTFDGKEIQAPIDHPSENNNLHSFSQNYEFALENYDENAVTLSLRLPFSRFYPFDIRVEITYQLGEDGLIVRSKSENLGEFRAPFGLGWHPCFDYGGRREDAVLEMRAKTHIELTERNLPRGEVSVEVSSEGIFNFQTARALGDQHIDDAFVDFESVGGEHQVILHRVDGKATTVWSDENYGAWQICTIDELGEDKAQGIFIEPCTCYANAFKTGNRLIIIEPKQSLHHTWGVRFA